jgi:hypothetical protein
MSIDQSEPAVGAARRGPHPGAAELSYSSVVPRELVHRQAVCEVFPTDILAVEDRYLVAVQPPRFHGYFADTMQDYYDPLLMIEAARQAGVLASHRFFGVSTDNAFIFGSMSFWTVDLEQLRIGPWPARYVYELTRREAPATPLGLDPLRFDITGWLDDAPVLSGWGEGFFIPRSTYAGLRAMSGGTADIAEAISRHLENPLPTPADLDLVGRVNPRNVVVTTPVVTVNGPTVETVCEVIVDPNHPGLFDHPQDHVPGMVLLEGLRQSAVASAALLSGQDGRTFILDRLSTKFSRFAELGEPLYCRTTFTAGRYEAARLTLEQGGETLAVVRLGLRTVTP